MPQPNSPRGNEWATVFRARGEALIKHGPLKAGPMRWSRLLQEEMREVEDELACYRFAPESEQAGIMVRAISELAQLAQLCIGVIELIQAGRIEEE